MNTRQRYEKSKAHIIAYFVTLSVAVGLMITGFCLPPKGEVHPSVLQASAILLAFYLAYDFPHFISSLRTFKVSKGDLSLEGETRLHSENTDTQNQQ